MTENEEIEYIVRTESDRYSLMAQKGELGYVQIDSPLQMKASDRFTIFWRGIADLDDVHDFIADYRNDALDVFCCAGMEIPVIYNNGPLVYSSLYFFETERVELAEKRIHAFPDMARIKKLQKKFGEIRFARYDIADADRGEMVFQLWSGMRDGMDLSPPEIGICANLNYFLNLTDFDRTADLIVRTLRPKACLESVRTMLIGLFGQLKTNIRN